MEIHTNIPLKNYTTMKLGGNARFMTEIHTSEELALVCKNARAKSIPILVLGGGSNTIVKDEGFDGIVLHIRIPGFEIIADDASSTTIKLGAGEIWDKVVEKVVGMNLSGVEAMSSIPGTVGAAPVQNVGAYGQEIAETLLSVEAYDTQESNFVNLQNTDCKFRYRDSIFKSEAKNRYIITSVTLRLSKNAPQPPFYDSLQRYLDEHNITIYTVDIIRNAVQEIRKNKLPDPNILPNTGSFFKNPMIDKWQLDNLMKQYPDIPNYEMGDGQFKIPAGWLIESAGLKNCLLHGMRVYDNNALVLINESAECYADLAAARQEIGTKVYDTFQISIEQEPIEI